MKISFSRSEKELISSIRNRDSTAMEKVYLKYRNEFVGWSKKKFGIVEDEALDHYQDTMTLFFEKIISGNLEDVESSIKTYVFGIGKNRVLQQFDSKDRGLRHENHVSEHYKFLAGENELGEIFERASEITEQVFKRIDDSCRKLLTLFYYEKKSMVEIAEIMGHKNEGVSRTSKKRCLEKIRQRVLKPSAE